MMAYRMGRWSQARSELIEALADNPQSSKFWAVIGACSFNLGDYDAAIDQCRKALALDATDDYALYVLALGHLNRSQIYEAEIAIEDALALNPENSDYLCTYAYVQAKHNKVDKSIELLDRALEDDPTNTRALRMKYDVLLASRRKTEAEPIRLQLLELDPENAGIHAASGWQALAQPGEYEAAKDHFEQALRLDPREQKNVDGLLEARYKEWSIHGPLAIKRHKWLLIAAPVCIVAVMAYTVACSKLHIDASPIADLLGLVPLCILILLVIAQAFNRPIYFLISMFKKSDRIATLSRMKDKLSGWLVVGAVVAIVVVVQCTPIGTTPELHWLYADWLEMYGWRFAWIAPILFLGAILGLLSGAVHVLRTHLKKQPTTTRYYTRAYIAFASAVVLGMFAFLAINGPSAGFTWFVFVAQLALFIFPQTAVYKNFVKAQIRKEQERLKAQVF
jgi:tetratricopeptide (TPR) repeat protein